MNDDQLLAELHDLGSAVSRIPGPEDELHRVRRGIVRRRRLGAAAATSVTAVVAAVVTVLVVPDSSHSARRPTVRPAAPPASATSPLRAPVQKGPPASAEGGVHVPPPSDIPTPADTDPNICGAWSAQGAPGIAQLESARGSISACLRYGPGWLLTTNPGNAPGYFGVLDCHGVASCLDGTKPKDLQAFTWLRAPSGNGVRLFEVDGSVLIFENEAGSQMEVDLSTGVFSGGPQ